MVASFATFGLFWGSWAVMLFNIQHTFSLNDAQSSVATRVQFDHLAPVAVGSVVLAEATLVKVEGRRLVFTVSAARLEGDGGGLVGAGRVTRVVVDRSTFLAKAGAAGPS